MYNGEAGQITSLQRAFLEPVNATHRQYEALRAYFVDKVPSVEAAARFGYTPGSFRVLCHAFRRDPDREFFLPERSRRHVVDEKVTKSSRLREKVVTLRKQNLSVYDIAAVLADGGEQLSAPAIWAILKEEGFSKLPRRADEERRARVSVERAQTADVRLFDLSPREFRTEVGGIFLFVPMLAAVGFDDLMAGVGLPGTKMVPAGAAMRSLLALKLFGAARTSHAMAAVFDEGLALFAGLNVVPKRSFLTEYSCRIAPRCYPALMSGFFEKMTALGLERGVSFHLDFHTIPFHGEDALSRSTTSPNAAAARRGCWPSSPRTRDGGCSATPTPRSESRTRPTRYCASSSSGGSGPATSQRSSSSTRSSPPMPTSTALNRLGISFITLRRRSAGLLEELAAAPASAWRRIELKGVNRTYRTPKVLDKMIELRDYEGPIRQVAVTDLGHEEPTLVLTNQLRRGVAGLVETYAKRMLIENSISDGVDFFHMDALSSAVAMKVNCDLQLTLMGSSLYRLLRGADRRRLRDRRVPPHLPRLRRRLGQGEDHRLTPSRSASASARTIPTCSPPASPTPTSPVPWWNGRRLRLVVRVTRSRRGVRSVT